MIERFYLKNYLSFKEAELDLACGLVVFTGPSGSGKSILMDSILSSVGLSSCEAGVCESVVSWQIDEDKYGIQNSEINIFRHTKKEKSRYFLNSQSIPRKVMSEIASSYLRHLSLRDFSDFENENLLNILDGTIAENINKLKNRYADVFRKFYWVSHELETIKEEERKIIELKEFASFEIKKIENINPTAGEDEKLTEIKKELSKKEKVLQSIDSANAIFEYEHLVSSALGSLDVDSGFFDDAMNELRAVFEGAQERFEALEDIDIENVLNRIEELAELKRRYGSIEEAIEYKEKKIKELEKYENIETKKDELQKQYKKLSDEVEKLANELTVAREKELESFQNSLNSYLDALYLKKADISMSKTKLSRYGQDKIDIKLDSTDISKISTGEFNRLRLAVLALKSQFMNKNGGVLILDEIDANLSGEESMSVAKVLKYLSKYFQIFVISHQPQLTSMGDQHFLVYKDNNESFVKKLDFQERINEIARIISGENISEEARRFAKELLENKNDN